MDVTSKVLLGLDADGFRRGIQQVDAKLKETSKLMGNLGQLIGASFAVSHIQAFTAEAIQLGSQLETVSKGFARFGDVSTLMELRKSTRGLVTDLDLMKAAVTAGNFGIPIEKLGGLLEFAKRRAQETGQSVDYLVESIVIGIGRKSPLILDNLGISTTRLKEKFHGAALEAQSIADVAAAVGDIADEELGKMGKAADTAADKMVRLGTSWQNFKASFGQAVAPAAAAVLQFATDQLTQMQIKFQLLKRELTTAKPSDKIRSQPMVLADIGNKAIEASKKVKKLKESYLDMNAEVERLLSLKAQFDRAIFAEFEFSFKENLQFLPPMSAIDETEGELVTITQAVKNFNQEMEAATAFGAMFGTMLTGAFDAAMVNGTSFFDEIGKALKNFVQQMIVALATTTALAAVFSAITGTPFKASFAGISKATGLGGFFGEGGMFNMKATVSGSDLLLGTQRSGSNFSRVGG